MNVLVFDTETTGLVQDRLPATHASQPSLVQLGAILYDADADRVRGEVNLIVKPEGRFTVPAEAARVHGITTEIADQFGVPFVIVLAAFNNLAKTADAFVAHNAAYDLVVMKRAYFVLERPHQFDDKPTICTMEALSPVMCLPASEKQRRWFPDKKYKSPNLQEAYAHVTGGGTFDGAHDAMADVRATLELFKWITRDGAGVQAAAE